MEFLAARDSDLEFLFNLRNEAVCVQYSKRGQLTRDVIKHDYLRNPKKQVFIAHHEQQAIAYAIYEDLAESGEQGSYEISVALVAGQRGKGLGAILLEEASVLAFRQLTAQRIVAYIYSGNSASIRLFQTHAYKLMDDSSEPWRWQREDKYC